MTLKRRDFIKNTALTGVLTGIGLTDILAKKQFTETDLYKGKIIDIGKPKSRNYWKPLENVFVKLSDNRHGKKIKIWDAMGNNYRTMEVKESFHFQVGGALGYHKITLHDANDDVVDWAAFNADSRTELQDGENEFHKIFDLLFQTLTSSSTYSNGKIVRYNNKYYKYYSSWFQDHVFVAEGMKYFTDDLKTGIDLYADGQREDGLIWDNYKHPYPELQSYWEYRFNYGGFTYRPEDPHSSAIFVRIPVENIGEHTFLEGLYYAWKATGDDVWMKNKLDSALKAVEFATSSPYYWSEEKQLLKRPFTIDRWDFQSDFDAKITGKDFMGVDLDRTRYGIMFGDNICMANGCKWLAEMLEHVGRDDDAKKMKRLSGQLWKRINEESWNGQFYHHWKPLNPEQSLDFGVDQSKQVTLSNAMALIRGLDHEKCVAIIKTYQLIKREMPKSSTGEWYMCYPPFDKGWHINKWEYMNGGVSPILAGDLALGAFEHGFESYGVDILRRVYQLAKQSEYKVHGCYKGKIQEPPQRGFQIIDLTKLANADIETGRDNEVPTFGSETADLRNIPTGKQTFDTVPFYIIDPSENNRKACMIVSKRTGFLPSVKIPVNGKAASMYLLHTTDTNDITGIFKIHYEDGSYHTRYISSPNEILHYWYPNLGLSRKGVPSTVIAWKGQAKIVGEVGVTAFGMDNPNPEKQIRELELINEQSSNWAVFGITLSDGPHYFRPSIVSTIPNHWASAHVLKALVEGLMGIKSIGTAFSKVLLVPRWEYAGVKKVHATAKYVPSGGYLSYKYQKLSDNNYEIALTGNGSETEIMFPLPGHKKINTLKLNGKDMSYDLIHIEKSNYVKSKIQGVGVFKVQIRLI